MSKHKKHHYHSHDRRPQFERAPARRGISPTAVVLASITYSLRSRAHAGRDGVVEQPAILSTFRKLAAATEEFATGCPGGHLPAIRARARDVGIASARLEDVLRQIREAKR